MALVLKIAAKGDVHRVRLEAPPTFDSLDALLRELYPKAGAAGGCRLARYTDEEGDACLLTRATFADFLETARTTGGGVCPVLRLEVLPPPLGSPAPERAGGAGAGAAEDVSRRLRAAGCHPRAENGSCAASPAASWLCVDAAHDRGSSDGSWVWAGGSPGGGSGQCSARGPPSPEPEGSWVELDSRSGSNERSQEETGPSEESFEPIALNLAELRADDWESSASGCSESDHTGKALHLLHTAFSSDQDGPQTVASRKEERAEAPAPAQEPAHALTPVSVPPTKPEPPETAAVEAAEGPEHQGQHAQSMWTDMKAGLGSAAPLPFGAPTSPHALEEKLPAAVAPPPAPPAVGGRRVKGKQAVESQRPLLVRAARQGGKAGQLDAGLEKVVHMGHICDGCEACPLPGPRFTCRVCRDFDLCWTCFMRKDQLPQPHDPSHRFQQVLWSKEVVPTCPGGCGFGVTSCSGHPTHCCARCADAPGQHTDACQEVNAHDDELGP